MPTDSHSPDVVERGWRNQSPPQPPNDYRAYHEPGGPAKLSTTVAHALADVMGIDVTSSGFSLYDSIDPDALDTIFAPRGDGTSRPPGHVAFCIEGYRVTVYSGGQIVITPPSRPRE